jgi:hypothetical protein
LCDKVIRELKEMKKKSLKSVTISLLSPFRWVLLMVVLALTVLPGEKVSAQNNLVPNPSFESFSGIPASLGEIYLAAPWNQPTTNGSSDYFHPLATALSGAGVPSNSFGGQSAHSGQAYAGFHARTSGYREYVETPLSQSLVPGQTYQVSFYVSLADNCQLAIDKIGAFLSAGPAGPVNTGYNLPFTPQISNPVNSFITNKTGWTLITGQYVAAGGESYLVIGNFFDDASTPTLAGQGGSLPFSYYYIDDVSVIRSGADLGDAPDSTTHSGLTMNTGYISNNQAHFPTVYDILLPGPAGPDHLDPGGFAYLGANVSLEDEADTGLDQDLLNNIDALSNTPNQDDSDDGVTLVPLPNGALTSFQFSATNAWPTPVQAYINVWFDWTHDGDWDDILKFALDPFTTGLAQEWAVQNYVIALAPVTTLQTFSTPSFMSPPQHGGRIWMRITLTDAPIDAAKNGGPFDTTNFPGDLGKGGSGPIGGYPFGETEDYFLPTADYPRVSGISGWGTLAFVTGIAVILYFLLKYRRKAIS